MPLIGAAIVPAVCVPCPARSCRAALLEQSPRRDLFGRVSRRRRGVEEHARGSEIDVGHDVGVGEVDPGVDVADASALALVHCVRAGRCRPDCAHVPLARRQRVGRRRGRDAVERRARRRLGGLCLGARRRSAADADENERRHDHRDRDGRPRLHGSRHGSHLPVGVPLVEPPQPGTVRAQREPASRELNQPPLPSMAQAQTPC